MSTTTKTPPEQIRYADLLFYGSWLGIFLMIITYLIYILGIMDPYIALQEVPKYWAMPVSDYLHHANVPQGWGWIGLLGKGDFLNFIGIALLALMTIVCFLTLIPTYAKQDDKLLLTIVILEVIVLSVAASGLLGSGGH